MTPKQARFVAEYLIDLNATQAAIRAGYSPKTANEQGARLLANVSVAAAIAEGQALALQRLAIAADEAIRLIADIARFDPVVLQDEAGNFRTLKDIPAAARRCIKRIRVHKLNLTTGDGHTDRVVDYEFYDKHAAIERDYKRMGLLKERVELEHRMTLEDLVVGSRTLRST